MFFLRGDFDFVVNPDVCVVFYSSMGYRPILTMSCPQRGYAIVPLIPGYDDIAGSFITSSTPI